MSKDGLNRRALGPAETAILIPVRLGGSRFPDKALKLLWGKPLFYWAYRAAVLSKVASVVRVIAGCSDVVRACMPMGVDCLLSHHSYPTGSDRLAGIFLVEPELFDTTKAIINLQCDEPQITTTDLTVLAQAVWESRSVQVATLATPLDYGRHDPNTVKVLVGWGDRALYFTRSTMPEQRLGCLAHVGVYAFRRTALESFGRYPRGRLEQSESLEQLRLIESGVPVSVVSISGNRRAVNSKEDLEWLEQQKSLATT